MIHKAPRLSAVLIVSAFLTAFAFPAHAAGEKTDKKKQKNSDVENIGSRDINKGNVLPTMSLQKEMQLGRQLAAQVDRQVKLFNDPVVNEYVNRVEQNIVRNSDAKVPFTVKI